MLQHDKKEQQQRQQMRLATIKKWTQAATQLISHEWQCPEYAPAEAKQSERCRHGIDTIVVKTILGEIHKVTNSDELMPVINSFHVF
jgi:hypothetical protein